MASRRNNLDSDEQLDLFTSQRPTNDTVDAIRPNGRETLARALPQDGARTGAEGPASSDASGSGGEDQGRDGELANRTHEAGQDGATSARPGLGDDSREIHSPPAGELNGPVRSVRRSVPEVRNEKNYRISDSDRIGEGPPRQQYRQNIVAIRTLRTLEAENRPATPDEKAVLVRYVGWGAMPQVFDPRNYEWREARAEVEQLLTPEELEAVRASTLNAHYTSPTVVRAMYGALERFGFEYGRILEPACGIGHFIGLMPEAMHRD